MIWLRRDHVGRGAPGESGVAGVDAAAAGVRAARGGAAGAGLVSGVT